MSTQTTSAGQVSGAAATSSKAPLNNVTHCAVCGYVGLDLSRLTCPRNAVHGVMAEIRLTAPEIVARWIISGQSEAPR